jgi:hypothetical protein
MRGKQKGRYRVNRRNPKEQIAAPPPFLGFMPNLDAYMNTLTLIWMANDEEAVPLLIGLLALALAGCGDEAILPEQAGVGPAPIAADGRRRAECQSHYTAR